MRVLEKTIEIDATPDEVWAVLTDFDDYGDWNPFVTSITGPVGGGRTAGGGARRRRADGRSP